MMKKNAIFSYILKIQDDFKELTKSEEDCICRFIFATSAGLIEGDFYFSGQNIEYPSFDCRDRIGWDARCFMSTYDLTYRDIIPLHNVIIHQGKHQTKLESFTLFTSDIIGVTVLN